MFQRLMGALNASSEIAEIKGYIDNLIAELDKTNGKLDKLQSRQDELKGELSNLNSALCSHIHAPNHSAQALDNLAGALEKLFDCFSKAGTQQVAPVVTDGNDPDAVTFKGNSMEALIAVLMRQVQANQLIKSQKRFTNRLLKLLRTVTEDPGKSITEELRKAEKWNKTLRKRVKGWEADYGCGMHKEAVNEG